MTTDCDQDLTDPYGEAAGLRASVDHLRQALARASLRLQLLGQVAVQDQHAEAAHRWADDASRVARGFDDRITPSDDRQIGLMPADERQGGGA